MDVNGSRLHYIDVGEGDPIVFVHGVPTSSYLWRNIIPALQTKSRCIALDLIGFGLSAKPSIRYSIDDHIQFFDAFITALNLEKITFILHGWGSVVGFNYISKHLSKTKAVAFYEAHIHPHTNWHSLSLLVQHLAMLTRNKKYLEKAIINDNYFLKKIFPMGMTDLPSARVMENYLAPFSSPESRRPLLQYIYDLALGQYNSSTANLIANYSTVIQKSSFPKLLLYSVPGFLTPISTVKWCRDNINNIELVDLGEELHFAQESNPNHFVQMLDSWYTSIN